jgi:hypothetical protein
MTDLQSLVSVVEESLIAMDVEFEQPTPQHFVVVLPGERKLQTTVSLRIGNQSLSVNAFVARHPDENVEQVYRWLLERNRRMSLVAFSIDHLGDIYLTAKLPHAAISITGIDHLLGAVLTYADDSFNTILELGFATAIRKEWQWRTDRGESTDNLAAFQHLFQPQGENPAR